MNHDYIESLKEKLTERQSPADFIDRCCIYAGNLISKGLPVLFDAEHVAVALKMSKRPCLYDYHFFPLITGGKTRMICAPSKRLKMRQRWILEHILSRAAVTDLAHGFEPNRSIKTHAVLHADHDYVVCMDLRDFFPSITEDRVIAVFQELGYTAGASRMLAEICCHAGVLPQGAPTSPKLANIICTELDKEIQDYAKANQITYSRYADDLTFSSDQPMKGLTETITAIAGRHYFQINTAKTQSFGPAEPKFITGLVVQNGCVRVPKRLKRELKKEIHFCQKFGVLLHLENTNAAHYLHYREHLYGKAYYIHMIEPEVGARFLNALDEIAWPEYML